LLCVGAVAILCLWGTPAPAEEPAEPPSIAELERLVATLRDDSRRAELVADLEALIAAQRSQGRVSPGAAVLERVSAQVGEIGRELARIAGSIGGWRDVVGWIADEARDPVRREVWLRAIGGVLLVVAVAGAAGGLARLALRAPRRLVEGRPAPGYGLRIALAVARLALDLVPTFVFAVVAYGSLTLIEPGPESRVIALALVNAAIAAQLVTSLARLLLSPLAPPIRLLPLGDEPAAYLDVWVRRIAGVAIYGYLGSQAVLVLGLPEVGYGLLVRLVGLVVTVLAIVFVLQNRASVATLLRGHEAARSRRPAALQVGLDRAADVWHLIAVAALVLAFGGWAFDVEGTVGYVARGLVATAAIALAARFAVGLLRRGMRRLMDVGAEVAERLPMVEARANRYLPILERLASGLVVAVALLLVLEAWDLGGFDWFATELGRDVLGRLVSIAGIVGIAIVAWEIGNGVIQRSIERAERREVRSARMRTLLPLARSTLSLVIAVIATFTVLAELGANIGPLLAGAGVVGLAVGFGAQTLVKDVITGAFILFEDQVAVDDVVEINGKTGTVESMTIRSLALRDGQGFLHSIPFSSVSTVTNMSRGYGCHLLEVKVASGEDVDRVAHVLREIDAELRAEPALARDVRGPFEVLGVEAVDGGGTTIRAQVRTRAGAQWGVGRAYRRAIKLRFDRDGIAFAQPRPV
jgi:small conductance mechanosensitive channel